MKTIIEITDTLRRYKQTLKRRFKVKNIGVFGSYARAKEKKRSDVDILVELSAPIGWEYIDLVEFLEDILEINVDLVTVNALKPQLRDVILKDVVYA